MSQFDEFRKPKSRKGGTCSRCGGPAGGRVVITLQERKRMEGRTSKDANYWQYPAVDSTSGTFCEPCSVAVYVILKDVFSDERSS